MGVFFKLESHSLTVNQRPRSVSIFIHPTLSNSGSFNIYDHNTCNILQLQVGRYMDIVFDIIVPAFGWIQSKAQLLTSQEAILLSALMATVGWTRSNSLSRKLNSKQHTMSVLLKDDNLQKGLTAIRPFVKSSKYPSVESDAYTDWQSGLRNCLNYYEFLCAGILRKDFDEKLIKTTERYTLLTLHQYAANYIDDLRKQRPQGNNTKDRNQIYRSIETIAYRWEKPWMRLR